MLLEGEFGDEILAEGAGGVVGGELNEATGRVPVVVPAGIVRDGVEADTENRNAEALSGADFSGDVAEPADGGGRLSAGFGDEDGTVITLVEIGEQSMEGTVQTVAGWNAFAFVDPLVVPVEVDADEIEEIGGASEARFGVAGEHVPDFKLGVGVSQHPGDLFGFCGIGDDADDGFGLNEAGGWIDCTNSVDGGDGGADEIAFELRAATGSEGGEVLDVSADPGPEGDLVNGAIEGGGGEAGGVAAVADEGGGGGGEGGEAGDELRGEGVEVIGHAPVAEIPENLRVGGEGGIEHGKKAGPVVDTRSALDEVPAEAVADGADAGLGKEGVVLSGAGVVVDGGEDVDAGAVAAAVGGALKAAEEEALKKRGGDGGKFCHKGEMAAKAGKSMSRPKLAARLRIGCERFMREVEQARATAKYRGRSTSAAPSASAGFAFGGVADDVLQPDQERALPRRLSARDFYLVHIEVGVDVLGIVEVFEDVEKAEHGGGLGAFELGVDGRDEGDFGDFG